MFEDVIRIKNALVEAVTAQKMIQDKLEKARADLETWRKRLAIAQRGGNSAVEKEVSERIRSLELLIAEFDADLMSQQDLESQLKATLHKIENEVSLPPPPQMPDFDDADETMNRLEGKILETEALAELSSRDEKRQAEHDAKNLALDAELEALKQSMRKKQEDS